MKTKVEIADINKAIKSVDYTKMGKKMTIALVTMTNGHEVVGVAGCVDPENYDQTIGEKIALDKAKDQMWPLLGFQLQCERHAAGLS